MPPCQECISTSKNRWFTLLDPPGQAFISKDTEMVVKGEAITLTCAVDEPGRPEATQFIWKRGGHVVNDVQSFNWTIDPVTLETEANISCVAINEVDEGQPDFINIQVIGEFYDHSSLSSYWKNALHFSTTYFHRPPTTLYRSHGWSFKLFHWVSGKNFKRTFKKTWRRIEN